MRVKIGNPKLRGGLFGFPSNVQPQKEYPQESTRPHGSRIPNPQTGVSSLY